MQMYLPKRLLSLLLSFALVFTLLPAQAWAIGQTEETEYSSTILFTHDMHAHFLPVIDETGSERGGFARLSTLLNQQRELHPDALTLDAGDFSMGSLFQSIYATEAPELRIMGALGYDATTFGNHEYDFRESGLAEMLEAAVNSGDTLPALLEANYLPPTEDDPDYDEADAAVWQAFSDYGVTNYILLERGGITYGIFGLMGEDSDADAPQSGMVFADPVETAKATVAAIQAAADPDQPLFIICLSHSGTTEDASTSEDEILAKKVDGIDLIVSGHSHTVLEEPIQVNDTLIVSAGCYTANLGTITVGWTSDGSKTVTSYELIPVDDTVEDDPVIAAKIESFQDMVVEDYLAAFGFEDFDQVIGYNTLSMDTVDNVYAEHRESGLGDLIADSYRYAVEQAEGENGDPITIALTATGVIRDSFPQGDITVAGAFSVSSLGIGTDGLAGYPLVSAYLTGAELKALCEVDASVSGLMPAAQLHINGLTFTWNAYRMIFNRVSSVQIQNEDGSTQELEDDQLYRVVTGLYCAQMLSAVKAKSFGILSITPKYADGTEITDFDDCILYDQEGNELKEWYALASYIQSFPDQTIPDSYDNSVCTTRKIQKNSLSPAALLTGISRLTVGILCLALGLLLLLSLLIRMLVRRLLRSNRYGGGTGYAGTSHSRPSLFRRRYGKGYRPAQTKTRRRRVSRRKYGQFDYHGHTEPTEENAERDSETEES